MATTGYGESRGLDFQSGSWFAKQTSKILQVSTCRYLGDGDIASIVDAQTTRQTEFDKYILNNHIQQYSTPIFSMLSQHVLVFAQRRHRFAAVSLRFSTPGQGKACK